MNVGRMLAVAAGVAAVACTIERADVRTPSGEPPEADSVRVREAIEAIATGFNRGDIASLDTIYHDSVTVFEDGSVVHGWTTYRDTHLVPELEALADRHLEFRDMKVRLAGSTAWAAGHYTLSAVYQGEEVSVRGVATLVFRRLGGHWRLVHMHTSSARSD